MEHAMLDALVSQCWNAGVKKLIGYYYQTEKNSMVSKLYKDFGFDSISADNLCSVWVLQVDSYINKNKYIKVVHDHG